jgi:hypothetical protein
VIGGALYYHSCVLRSATWERDDEADMEVTNGGACSGLMRLKQF